MKKMIGWLMAIPLCASAQATNGWVDFTQTPQATFYISPERIHRDMNAPPGSIFRAWEKIVFKTPQDHPKGKYTISMVLYSVNCHADTLRSIQGAGYNARGTLIWEESGASQEQPVMPESIGENFLKLVCLRNAS